jgi:hypothetical protein
MDVIWAPAWISACNSLNIYQSENCFEGKFCREKWNNFYVPCTFSMNLAVLEIIKQESLHFQNSSFPHIWEDYRCLILSVIIKRICFPTEFIDLNVCKYIYLITIYLVTLTKAFIFEHYRLMYTKTDTSFQQKIAVKKQNKLSFIYIWYDFSPYCLLCKKWKDTFKLLAFFSGFAWSHQFCDSHRRTSTFHIR